MQADITQLLQRVGEGDKASEARLMELVYGELHRLATGYLRRERKDHTLQPSALVNEAYLRLVGTTHLNWQSRGQFYAAAARIMRHILIDHARACATTKRARHGGRVEMSDAMLRVEEEPERFLMLDTALNKLAAIDQRQVQVVELRFFGGLSVEETASSLGISEKTVKRDWAVARAWLEAELSGDRP